MNQLLKKMKYIKPLYQKSHMSFIPMPMLIPISSSPSSPPPKKPQTDNIKSIINIRDLYKIKKHSLIEIKEYKCTKACALILAFPVTILWIISYDMVCHISYFSYHNLLSSNNFINMIPCSFFFVSSAYIVCLPFFASNLNTSIKKWRNLHTNSEKLIVDFKASNLDTNTEKLVVDFKSNIEMDNAYKKLVEDFNALKKEEQSS